MRKRVDSCQSLSFRCRLSNSDKEINQDSQDNIDFEHSRAHDKTSISQEYEIIENDMKFLTNIVKDIENCNSLGWLKQSKLKKMMEVEENRIFLIESIFQVFNYAFHNTELTSDDVIDEECTLENQANLKFRPIKQLEISQLSFNCLESICSAFIKALESGNRDDKYQNKNSTYLFFILISSFYHINKKCKLKDGKDYSDKIIKVYLSDVLSFSHLNSQTNNPIKRENDSRFDHTQTNSRVWDSIVFWDDLMIDRIDFERQRFGLNGQDAEDMVKIYKTQDKACQLRKSFEELEDKIIAVILFNCIIFMKTVCFDTNFVRSVICRLTGKCHLGLKFSSFINSACKLVLSTQQDGCVHQQIALLHPHGSEYIEFLKNSRLKTYTIFFEHTLNDTKFINTGNLIPDEKNKICFVYFYQHDGHQLEQGSSTDKSRLMIILKDLNGNSRKYSEEDIIDFSISTDNYPNDLSMSSLIEESDDDFYQKNHKNDSCNGVILIWLSSSMGELELVGGNCKRAYDLYSRLKYFKLSKSHNELSK